MEKKVRAHWKSDDYWNLWRQLYLLDSVLVGKSEVEDVLNGGDVVGLSSDGPDKIGSGLLGSAGNLVELILTVECSSGLLDNGLVDGGGGSDPGGTGVGDDLVLLLLRVGSNGESVDGELPVGLSGQGNVVDAGVAVDVVESSVGDLSEDSGLSGLEVTVEPDGEERGIQLREDVLHGGNDLVDGKSGPSETEDSVHGLLSEDGGQVGGDSEFLGGDGQSSESNGILSQVTVAGSRSVLDGEGTGLSLVGGGSGGVELVLGVSRVGGSVAGGGLASGIDDPQVGGSSIQNKGDSLGRSSDGDVSEVEVIEVVDEGLGSGGEDLSAGLEESLQVLGIGSLAESETFKRSCEITYRICLAIRDSVLTAFILKTSAVMTATRAARIRAVLITWNHIHLERLWKEKGKGDCSNSPHFAVVAKIQDREWVHGGFLNSDR